VDISPRAVEFCRRHHHVPGLSFVHGDAERLPAEDGRFDVVVNLESSHGYGSLPRFFGEVRRVLRPGGYFAYADHRHRLQLDGWFAEIGGSGLERLAGEDITDGVTRALDLDDARKRDLLERRSPRLLRSALGEFAALRGSAAYRRFAERDSRYWTFLFRKPA
jgi:SAM-dependent methyltransferase